ncbi:MAG: hypothetical protein M1372_00475 [Patescibacteria group bacterium]|nr:hypothetical protein [Patescibacteria group bacterium]
MRLEQPGHGVRSSIAVPIPREAQEARRGILSRLAGSKLVDAALALASIGGGIQIAHTINSDIPSVPGLYEEAKRGIDYVWGLMDPGPPSKGDFFNPKRDSGEISSLNTVPLPIDQQIALINARTSKDGSTYFILPNPGGDTIHYEKSWKGSRPIIELKDLPVGSTFVSPYEGFLGWTKYYQNGSYQGMSLEILSKTEMEENGSLKILVFFNVTDINLLLPESLFRTTKSGPSGNETVVGSQIPIKAGQPIFTVASDRVINDPSHPALGGNYQVEVGTANIPSSNNKAVVSP